VKHANSTQPLAAFDPLGEGIRPAFWPIVGRLAHNDHAAVADAGRRIGECQRGRTKPSTRRNIELFGMLGCNVSHVGTESSDARLPSETADRSCELINPTLTPVDERHLTGGTLVGDHQAGQSTA
jgi:hypothetical protein